MFLVNSISREHNPILAKGLAGRGDVAQAVLHAGVVGEKLVAAIVGGLGVPVCITRTLLSDSVEQHIFVALNRVVGEPAGGGEQGGRVFFQGIDHGGEVFKTVSIGILPCLGALAPAKLVERREELLLRADVFDNRIHIFLLGVVLGVGIVLVDQCLLLAQCLNGLDAYLQGVVVVDLLVEHLQR